MRITYGKWQATVNLLAAIVVGTSLTGCIDDNYDLDKDIDMTMGFGAEGLQVKIGSTQKVMLADLLDTNDNLKTDETSLYYMVESGSTETDFTVDRTRVEIERAKLSPEVEVFNYDKMQDLLGLNLPAGVALPIVGNTDFNVGGVEAADDIDMTFELDEDATENVKEIRSIAPVAGTKLNAKVVVEQGKNLHFGFKKISNLTVNIPSYLKLSNPTKGHLNGQKYTFDIDGDLAGVREIDLGTADVEQLLLPNGEGIVKDGILELKGQRISMTGDFELTNTQDSEMADGDHVNIHLYVSLGEYDAKWCKVELNSITGRFNPEIVSSIEDFEVKKNLPDFLTEDGVKIVAMNPTIRFDADMREIPASFELRADLKSTKDGAVMQHISIPADQTQPINIQNSQENTVYVYQGDAPYDPNGVVPTEEKHAVAGMADLITDLPDFISVDISDGKVRVKDEVFTLQINHTYHLNLDYHMYVPFVFDRGLSIVYTDSIEDLNEDLSDFEAEGLILSADVINAVPLELKLTAEAFDVKDRLIPGLEVMAATIQPATAVKNYADEAAVESHATRSNIEIKLKLQDPADLKRIEKIRYKVAADGVQAEGTPAILSSLQFLQFENMRLKLAGKVIGNFN